MKHDKLRVSKIIEEIINYFFALDISDMDINIKENEKHYKLHFYVRGEVPLDAVNKLDKMLHVKKQEEMEEYYWFLAGDSDVDTELALVGMMTDSSEVKYVEGKSLEVTLYRNKSIGKYC